VSDFPRDRWGRPLVTPPGGGKPQPYSRFSSWGQVLEDRFGLERWKVRTAGIGLSQQPHLLAQVAACPATDSKRLDALMEEALKFGGSSTGSGLGTALHEFTARVDTGDLSVDAVIDPWGADVRAYLSALDAHGLEVVHDLVEVTLAHDDLKLAGTADRFFRRKADGRLVCADVKTGKSIGDNPLAYIVQLATYATSVCYEPDSGERWDVGDVDHAVGLLVHLPAGKATCTIYEVDLAAGMELARLAGVVRAAQKRKDLLRTINPADDTPFTVEKTAWARKDRVEWVRDRIVALRDLGARIDWPEGLVTPKAALGGAPVTDEDVEAMVVVLDLAETRARAPFPPEDPAIADPPPIEPTPALAVARPPKPDEGRTLTDAERDDLKAWVAVHAADPEVYALITRTVREGDRGIAVAVHPSERRWLLARALVVLAHHGEEVMRAACALVIPDAAMPAVTIGSAMAAMTIDEATRLLGVAVALDAQELVLGFAADGTPALFSAA
jgi:hypothetical protein